jgi:PAS domain S-box-containing protein
VAKGTILVVEDDALIAAHIESVLAAAGYTVLPPVAFGEEAVAAVTAHPPDLILMDIQLAGAMDGIEAVAQVQAQYDIPVVYLTAYAQDERLTRARATTPYGYLTKPVSGHELLATIDTVLYRHAADRRVRESEARYRNLVANVPGAVYRCAVEHPRRAIFVSDAVQAISGRPASEFLCGDTLWLDLIVPDDLIEAERALAGARERRAAYSLEYRIRHADGGLRWVHDNGRFDYDASGVPISMDGILLDITARKQLEAERDAALRALQERDAYLTAIIENLPGVVWLKDREGRFLALNRAHAVPSGLDGPEHVVGKTDLDVLPRDQAERYRAEDALVMESGQSLCVEELIFDRGEYKWVQKYKTPIRDADGVIIGTTGYSHDITALKRAASEQLARELLEAEKLRGLSVLAAEVANEFITTLQAMVAELDLALSEPELDVRTRQRLESAVQTAERANRLTRPLLDYGSAGRLSLDDVSLPDLVNEHRQLFEVAVGPHATLHLAWPDDLPPLRADRELVRLALLHLVINAGEAIGPQPGLVTLTGGVTVCDAACLANSLAAGGAAPGRYVFVEVTDNGCGMDAVTRRRLAEPGFTTKSAGRGLGLLVVQSVLRAHGGIVTVDSEIGVGTTVRLFFPAVAPVTGGPQPFLTLRETRPGMRWLVAEGDSAVRRVMLESLARFGYSALAAATGGEAVQLVQRHSAELAGVLLDVALPGLDGPATCAALRQLRPDLPVILVSGYDEAAAASHFAGLDPVACVQKPWRLETLARALRAAARAEG